MATKNITNANTAATLGLSNAELEAELVSELPEREEMCGFHRWYSCWHPCYDYHPVETFSSSYSSVTSYSSTSSFIR
jgi:hypothetical protein